MTVPPSRPDVRRLWLGTYPAPGTASGSGEGVWRVDLDLSAGRFDDARQVVSTPSPSFVALAPDERTLYAVDENTDGGLSAFRVEAPDGDGLELLATVPSGGADPCHVVATPAAVWVANYSSGTFTTVAVDGSGGFAGEPEAYAGEGTGPDTDRQEGPHAHYAVPTPDGSAAWVVDLGADRVRRYRVTADGTGVEAAGTAVTLPAGAGPRHLVFGAAGTAGEGFAFVVGELDDRVHVLALHTDDDGLLAADAVAAVPACTTPGPEGVGAFPSHVALSSDGTRLYVAVRGPDVVAVHDLEPDGHAVRLAHRADAPLEGVWPRHFAVLDTADGDVLVVAGQNSSTLEALRVLPGDAGAEPVASLTLPSPACVVERRILEG
ncbi:lactonase family protein [Luteimicrobium sp. NPDC057192]|uniref:lactonase family protein n=1 Tax=Luteimicrobium sp. NPDC057192 TaxID=3346042 RepID=UPI00362CFC83